MLIRNSSLLLDHVGQKKKFAKSQPALRVLYCLSQKLDREGLNVTHGRLYNVCRRFLSEEDFAKLMGELLDSGDVCAKLIKHARNKTPTVAYWLTTQGREKTLQPTVFIS
jgi:hypothetical protein